MEEDARSPMRDGEAEYMDTVIQDEEKEEKMEDEEMERLGSKPESEQDPNTKMLVTEYDPLLVSVHADSFIRFWTMEVTMVSFIQCFHSVLE